MPQKLHRAAGSSAWPEPNIKEREKSAFSKLFIPHSRSTCYLCRIESSNHCLRARCNRHALLESQHPHCLFPSYSYTWHVMRSSPGGMRLCTCLPRNMNTMLALQLLNRPPIPGLSCTKKNVLRPYGPEDVIVHAVSCYWAFRETSLFP